MSESQQIVIKRCRKCSDVPSVITLEDVDQVHSNKFIGFVIECKNPEYHDLIQTQPFKTKEEAIEKWNKDEYLK